jgi:hypothetical protein
VKTSEKVMIILIALLLISTTALLIDAVGNIDERVDRLEGTP